MDASLKDSVGGNLDQLNQLQTNFLPTYLIQGFQEVIKEVKHENKIYQQQLQQQLAKLVKQIKSLPSCTIIYNKEKKYLKWLCSPKIEQKNMERPVQFLQVQKVEYSVNFEQKLANNLVVDILVFMPNEMFERKDYLNHRYHFKRFMFLQHLKQYIFAKKQTRFEFINGDLRLPVLLVNFSKQNQKKVQDQVQFRILPVIDSNLFPEKRFERTQNNLRPPHEKQKEFKKDELNPTPRYNQSILEDILRVNFLLEQNSQLKQISGINEAILLVKLWFSIQIQIIDTDQIIFAIINTLIENGEIILGMSTFQLFRAILLFMSKEANFKGNLNLNLNVQKNSQKKITKENFQLLDSERKINFLLNFNQGIIRQIRSTAARSLEALRSEVSPPYQLLQQLFIKPVPQNFKWDYLYSMNVQIDEEFVFSNDLNSIQSVVLETEKILLKGLQKRAAAVRVWYDIGTVENFAFSNTNIQDKNAQNTMHTYNTENGAMHTYNGAMHAYNGTMHAYKGSNIVRFYIGVNIASSGDVWKTQERAVQGENIAQFKSFWGEEKCGTFRFEDGTTGQAVNWNKTPSWCRHRVVDEIVEHLITRHVPNVQHAAHVDVTSLTSQIEKIFESTEIVPVEPEESRIGFLKLKTAVSKIHKILDDLDSDQMALKVTMTVDVNSYVYQFEPDGPLPNPVFVQNLDLNSFNGPVPRVMTPIHIILMVDHSGKWPDNIEQYYSTKISLATQFAERLEQLHQLDIKIVGDLIDVFLDGFVFRLQIRSLKDDQIDQISMHFYNQNASYINALQQQSTGDNTLDIQKIQNEYTNEHNNFDQTSNVGQNLKKLIQNNNNNNKISPTQCKIAHNGLMGFLAGEHPSFPGAVRMLKTWVQTNLLGNGFEGEALELLGSFGYVCRGARATPGTPISGFLCVLWVLANFRWSEERMVIDPQKKLDSSVVADLVQNARNKCEDGPAVCICTAYDTSGAFWTSRRPSKELLPRIVQLANETLNQIHSYFQNPYSPIQTSDLFSPKILEDYDVLIHLRKEALPWGQFLNKQQKNKSLPEIRPKKRARVALMGFTQNALEKINKNKLKQEIVVGFNPVQYMLGELEKNYGDLGVFSGNKLMGDVIAIKWKSKNFVRDEDLKRIQKVDFLASSPLICESEDFHVCIVSILEDIQEKMQGLIQSIEFVKG